MSLPRDAVCWSVANDCGILGLFSFPFSHMTKIANTPINGARANPESFISMCVVCVCVGGGGGGGDGGESNYDNVLFVFVFLADEGRKDQHTTISGSLLARQQNAI